MIERTADGLWLLDGNPQRENYNDHYKKEYGYSYTSPRASEQMYADAGRRSCAIRRYLPTHHGRLFDIGCSYGVFLSVWGRDGSMGCDTDMIAIEYCQDNRLHAWYGRFPNDYQPFINYNSVTAWWVLEHIPNWEAALKEIHTILTPGGIFAFSTARSDGGYWRFKRKEYIDKMDENHYTLWSERAVRRILPRYGFKVLKIERTGLHPERYGWPRWLARLMRMHDTMEVYARKI